VNKSTLVVNQQNKSLVWDLWTQLDAGDHSSARAMFTDDFVWHGPEPIGELRGAQAFIDEYLIPLSHSFPDLTRETFLFFGGVSSGQIDGDIERDGRMWVTGTGNLRAIFANDFLGIPASGDEVAIRWGDFTRLENGKIAETFFLVDLVDLMHQAGIDVLPAARGAEGLYPPPALSDGILHAEQDSDVGMYSLDHIRRFIFDGLNAFDETDLESMGMADWFDPDVRWYGPGGIGACLSFGEFESLHQAPWLVAFPDRSVQDLDALFAEGVYSGAPGWAGVRATHTGTYLDQPATGKTIEFNGLDWWKRDGEKYVENWVFVDMIHLFRQFGVDLFDRIPS
jgi:ketosteroid isomerase-like protein